jgi:hypothetical protein
MRAEEMAGRARKMGSRARRGEIPDAPWENPALRLHLSASEPDVGDRARGRCAASRRVGVGPTRVRGRPGRAHPDQRAKRQRQIDAARRPGRADRTRARQTSGRTGSGDRPDRSGSRSTDRTGDAHRPGARAHRSGRVGGPDRAGGVRPPGRSRRAQRRNAVTWRADPRGADRARTQSCDLPAARRADEPPRHRVAGGARGGARALAGRAGRRHARPPVRRNLRARRTTRR